MHREDNEGAGPSELCMFQLFAQACAAVAHLHAQEPPIAHRDVKLENMLLGGSLEECASGACSMVLCDFGSATTRAGVYRTRKDVLDEEDRIQRYTTMAYRSPEMVDLYQYKRIDEKVGSTFANVLHHVCRWCAQCAMFCWFLGCFVFLVVADAVLLLLLPSSLRLAEFIDDFANASLTDWRALGYCPQVDVWALGVLLYLMAYNKFPFDPDSPLGIINGKYTLPPGAVQIYENPMVCGARSFFEFSVESLSLVSTRVFFCGPAQHHAP
jgi:serine/threonine protein kinase